MSSINTDVNAAGSMIRGSQRPRICFVSPTAYNVLAGRDDLRHIGGAEVQQCVVARGLAERGFIVSMVTQDHGQNDGAEVQGIRVYKAYDLHAGIWGMRFFHPRWSGIWRAMKRADADVYYQRTAGCETGQVASWCRLKHRKFLLAIANDPECDHRLGGKGLRDRWFYRYGLKHADMVIAQTQVQQQMLLRNFGIEARLVRSCAPAPDREETMDVARRLEKPCVLWIGRFSPQKRVDRLIELARICPQVHFDVLGSPNRASGEADRMIQELGSLTNVKLHGFVPHHQIGRYYDRAAALICTSAWEGFPNVFLEAWSRGVPVVSTLDPDGLVAQYDLGRVADTVGGLKCGLEQMLNSSQEWTALSVRVRQYWEEHHSISRVVDAYEDVIATMMSCPSAG